MSRERDVHGVIPFCLINASVRMQDVSRKTYRGERSRLALLVWSLTLERDAVAVFRASTCMPERGDRT
jgi:hypothetical protein